MAVIFLVAKQEKNNSTQCFPMKRLSLVFGQPTNLCQISTKPKYEKDLFGSPLSRIK